MEAQKRRPILAGPGRLHIEDLKRVMHSVKTVPTGLYGITSDEFGQTHLESARIFIECGARIVQYRCKRRDGRLKSTSEMVKEAKEIKALCLEHKALFIVDDRLDVAIQADADGLHLGQEDVSIKEAKARFNGIIGVSAKTLEQAIDAEKAGADYLGVGAVFPTNTKGAAIVIGLDGLSRIVGKVSIPIYAIGGIKLENLHAVKRIGPYGIAVISGILAAPDPVAIGKSIARIWNQPDIGLGLR